MRLCRVYGITLPVPTGMYMYQYIPWYSYSSTRVPGILCCAGGRRRVAGQRKQVNLRVPAPFVAHDSVETLRIGCVCFVEETPKQRLKHSYPQERGEKFFFFSAFVKCSE